MLASRLQMPTKLLVQKIQEIKSQFLAMPRKMSKTTEAKQMIDKISTYFRMSKSAVKIRLLELGYEEAKGIYNYVDGHYVPAHSFDEGKLRKNQTFYISLQDAQDELENNLAFMQKLQEGHYIYVESHFCLNDSKYLLKLSSGKIALTQYDRNHMDECCLVFDLVSRHKKITETTGNILYREANSHIVFEAKFTNEQNIKEAILIQQRLIELQQLVLSLPGSFSGTVSALIKWSEMTLEKVSEKSLLNEKTLLRLKKDEGWNYTIETIIQLCIGLQLPPELSQLLIERSTKRFGNTELHFMYRFILNCCYMTSIFECNALLEKQGFKRLGKEL